MSGRILGTVALVVTVTATARADDGASHTKPAWGMGAKVRRAWETLEVGAVIQGDVPTWRSDPMPYGGVKASGVGREGPASAFLEMTEERMLVLR